MSRRGHAGGPNRSEGFATRAAKDYCLEPLPGSTSRCFRVRGHRGAHAARVDAGIMHWRIVARLETPPRER
jgi:hypothetical protein